MSHLGTFSRITVASSHTNLKCLQILLKYFVTWGYLGWLGKKLKVRNLGMSI
jgi:hypothetical protein